MNPKFIQLTFSLALAAVLFSSSLTAQQDAEKPSFSATQSVQLSATVVAIKMQTREVSLLGDNGETQTITVAEDSRNLGQIEPGDQVTAEFVRELDIQVFADDGGESEAGALTAAGRGEAGDNPDALAIGSELITARVADIDLEASTIKLQWPDNSVEEFVAKNPDKLRQADVGDIAVISFNKAVGIISEKPDSE